MNKHIFGITTYFVTFFISISLVAVFGVKQESAIETYTISTTAPLSRTYETVEQREIGKFLAADRAFGLKYYATSQNDADTKKLVSEMRSLDISNLPMPIRKSYKVHTQAWKNYAEHLSEVKDHNDSDKECRILNREINQTYSTLVLAAKNYGVDFDF